MGWRHHRGHVLLITAVVVSILGRGNQRKREREDRARRFEEWVRTRGLLHDPTPVPTPQRFWLLRKTNLQIDRAATRRSADGRITVMDWSYTSDAGAIRTVRLTGLLVTTGPTGSHLDLEPAGTWQLPSSLSGQRRWTSGDERFDDTYTVLTADEHDPTWLDGGVREALIDLHALGKEVTVEVADDAVIVSYAQLDPRHWDALYAGGEQLAHALAGPAVDP